jgi:hypothetical protein
MRRGFYGWDALELPLASLEQRTLRLQTAMRAEKLDGVLLYTNIARPAAVSWLTGFTPYWSEGLLFVPPQGEPDFATALSNRVAEWMRAVTPTGSILCTPQPAVFFGKRLADEGAKRLGVLELDLLPGGQAAALMNAAPGLELVDITAMYQAVRSTRDDAEAALFAKAAEIARASFDRVETASVSRAHDAMGAVEKAARDQRAEEIYVSIAPDLSRDANFLRVDRAPNVGAAFAIRASLAYKSTWVRHTRSFSTDPATAARFAAHDAAFEACIAQLDQHKSLAAQLSAGFAKHTGARLAHWSLESCRGSYPLEFIAGDSEANAGSVSLDGAVLSVVLEDGTLRWVGQRPILRR